MTSPESSSLDGNQSLTIVVDTSQKDGRLLLVDHRYNVVFSAYWTHPKRHTELLLTEFKKAKSFITNNSLEKIVFISGPGSFTGLRVGASFVKSLGFVYKNSPIYCVTAFRLTAVHALKKLNLEGAFSVCVSSIGDMVFRADYEASLGVFQKEKIHTDGAQKYTSSTNKVFSPNADLSKKFVHINHVQFDDGDYLNVLRELDQNKANARIYSHLDLYPLYLRKSEAEEKHSYDKVKL